MLAENNIRKGFFEEDQLSALIKQLPERVKPEVRFAYITGWRTKSEILTLQWKQVHFHAEEIRLDPAQPRSGKDECFRPLLSCERFSRDRE
jgi:hypothetical protein